MSTIVELTDATFDSTISAQGTVLVDFWAPWCGPCRMQTPILEKLAAAGVSAVIAKVNTDENPATAQKLGISSIPTLILFKGGQEADRMVGVQPETVLKDKLK